MPSDDYKGTFPTTWIEWCSTEDTMYVPLQQLFLKLVITMGDVGNIQGRSNNKLRYKIQLARGQSTIYFCLLTRFLVSYRRSTELFSKFTQITKFLYSFQQFPNLNLKAYPSSFHLNFLHAHCLNVYKDVQKIKIKCIVS